MTTAWLSAFATPAVPGLIALGIAALLLVQERRREPILAGIIALAVLAPLALVVARAPAARPEVAALNAGLVVAALARDRRDALHSECGIKLLWVIGGALALSWTGVLLLTTATGTAVVAEQWAVLQLGLDPMLLWSSALSLSLIAGLVLLGGAPFHFWVGDVFQGVRPWLAPLAVAALQVTGAAWLVARLDGIAAFPAGERVVAPMLDFAAAAAFLAGAAALLGQRRPERRVGTLASLQGGLVLATLAAAHGGGTAPGPDPATLAAWATHLALALTGAGTLSHFLPVSTGRSAPPVPLFRHHPITGTAGLFALASLAGVPGTPGARVWLETARALAAAGHTGVLIALAAAWLAAFASAVQQAREAYGTPAPAQPPGRAVPWESRIAIGIAALAVAAVGVAWSSMHRG